MIALFPQSHPRLSRSRRPWSFAAALRLLAALTLVFPAGPAAAAKEKGKEEKSKNAGKKGSSDTPKGKKKGGKNDVADKVMVWLRVGKVVGGGVQVVVQPYQRLADIAETYGVSTKSILGANKNISANVIKAGQKVFIPGATSVKAIKTLVPSDKLDMLEGFGVQLDQPEKDSGQNKGEPLKNKAKPGGPPLVKSGKKTAEGVEHTVLEGQTLHIIAQAYGMSASALIKVNNLKNKDIVNPGQKILVPGADKVVAVAGIEGTGEAEPSSSMTKSGKVVKAGVLHTVMPGQTLSHISSAYKVKIPNILNANGLKNANSIKVGDKLLIPEAEKVVAVKYSPSAAQNMLYVQPITFHRIHTGETKTINLFKPSGKQNKGHYAIFKNLMFDHRAKKTHDIHARLMLLLARVAKYFDYKTLIIYSGYRKYQKGQYTKHSKHNQGRAIDFAVEGVSNWKLQKYCRNFSNTGVGYYPNSYFVHLDAREASAFWIDYSGPGESPHYGKKKKDLEKKAKKGAFPPKAGVDDEAESDAVDVDIPK
ncbi:MAG: LysM peptidoglycan-binding domain-containing protein [Pseudomonadota bacterium]